MEKPDLTGATTYRSLDADKGDRWHILADGKTVVYQRNENDFEVSKIVTASALRRGGTWVEVSRD
jgi:hypothetical protein